MATEGSEILGYKRISLSEDLYQDNYVPLLNIIKQNLNGYPVGSLSWLGRIKVIKMVILLRVLYVFQVLPINTLDAYFKTLRSSLKRFIWTHWGSHDTYKVLVRPKSNERLALPDLETYHK